VEFALKQAEKIDNTETERVSAEKRADCFEQNLNIEQKARKDQENLV